MAKRPENPQSKLTTELQYVLVRSRRRTLSLIVLNDGALEIRCPLTYPRKQVDDFVQSKADWIFRKRQENLNSITVTAVPAGQKALADQMIRSCYERISAEFTGKTPVRLTIRDQRSRWGSCSSRGNISLNRRCSQLPVPLLEYVILHELCHLVHLNHSTAFWQLLESHLPDARQRRSVLNRYRLT